MTDKQVIKELIDIIHSLMNGTQCPSTTLRALKFIDNLKVLDKPEIPHYHITMGFQNEIL